MWDINKTSFKEKQNSTGMSETGTKKCYTLHAIWALWMDSENPHYMRDNPTEDLISQESMLKIPIKTQGKFSYNQGLK